jgi:hypothetical protein
MQGEIRQAHPGEAAVQVQGEKRHGKTPEDPEPQRNVPAHIVGVSLSKRLQVRPDQIHAQERAKLLPPKLSLRDGKVGGVSQGRLKNTPGYRKYPGGRIRGSQGFSSI